MRLEEGVKKYHHAIKRSSELYKLPITIIAAVIATESAFDRWAIKYEPHYSWLYGDDESEKTEAMRKLLAKVDDRTEWKSQQFSYGLMQVMGAVAREYGYEGKYLTSLCRASQGLKHGCMHLKIQVKRYSGNVNKGLAAYNAGSARYSDNGKFVNQHYVDTVLMNSEAIKNLGLLDSKGLRFTV